MLNLIIVVLSIFGMSWLILGYMIIIFGGSIKVIIQNPITKQKDVLTDINTIRD